jgi:ribA/ribD-fused uncharacterized protein
MPINEFKGEHAYLSNFWPFQGPRLIGPPAPILWKGVSYATAEHLYQCAKAVNSFDRTRIITARTPGIAKRIGREIQIRPDWKAVQHDIMLQILRAKFQQHPDLAAMLIATSDQQLVEGNWHGDSHWGYDFKISYGENCLGRLLMTIRAELQTGRSAAA